MTSSHDLKSGASNEDDSSSSIVPGSQATANDVGLTLSQTGVTFPLSRGRLLSNKVKDVGEYLNVSEERSAIHHCIENVVSSRTRGIKIPYGSFYNDRKV